MLMTMAYAAEEGLRDIRPIVETSSGSMLWWVIGVVVLLIVAASVWWTRMRTTIPTDLPDDPIEVASAQLDVLLEQSGSKAAYVQLSHVLRTFLEHTQSIAALEMTMPELARALKESNQIHEDERLQLIELCERMNMVAYGPDNIDASCFSDDVKMVWRLVTRDSSPALRRRAGSE